MARRGGDADPHNHVTVNAILYTPRGKYWAMTERGRASLERSRSHVAIGPSQYSWTGDRLVIDIDEKTMPIPRRINGRITVDPGPVFSRTWNLDAAGRHEWRPIAPCAKVDVQFERPSLNWKGHAYVDTNAGTESLEAGFRSWTWSRQDRRGTTRIHYDVIQRNGVPRGLALDYNADGTVVPFEPAPIQDLPLTGWRVSRHTRAHPSNPARVLKGLEDTPFYSRSVLGFDGEGKEFKSVHESVDLDRFRSPIVQMMLPFKMPRWTRRR
ncbi:carotenoid 1,2-hydratase [Rhodoligotrophos appendicifer]